MTAASLSTLLGTNFELKLIESDAIGTLGVGESTIPTMQVLHQLLKINESEFVAAVQGTFKLGISFENWRDLNQNYIHSFGWTGQDCWAAGFQHFWLKARELGFGGDYGDYCAELVAARQHKFAVLPDQGLNYAYHIDAGLYAGFLRRMAEKNGCTRVEGKVTQVNQNPETGHIESVALESGERHAGDLFIDCSGFRALLIGDAMGEEFEDWSHWLPCDRAIAIQTRATKPPVPYTRAIARDAGWQWRIPLQTRMGNGLVYSSQYTSDDQALELLLDNIDGETLIQPNNIRFRPGQRPQPWRKNCVAIGLSAGFIEPLEATSIHLIQQGIIRLMQMFPHRGICTPDITEYNRQMCNEMEHIRDFIILHYHVTKRSDTEFWRYCRHMPIPDSLQHRIELFQETGRVFQISGELFAENSWVQVMLGQGLLPAQYHPIVNMMSDGELRQFMQTIKSGVQQTLTGLPEHQLFINRYCKVKAND